MAFVGVSTHLSRDIRERIDRMRGAELDSAGANVNSKFDYVGNESWLKPIFWDGRPDLEALLPAHWADKPERVDIYVKLVKHVANGQGKELLARGNFQIKVDEKATVAPCFKSNYRPEIVVEYESVDQAPVAMQPVLQYAVIRDGITNKWNDIREKVLNFVESCKSLNEALKLWPELRMYIPQEYLDRVDRKVTRNKSEDTPSKALEALAGLDTQEIQAAAVVARMHGAKL